MSELVISARAVTRKFGEYTALNGLDLDLAEGSIVGLIGPSGGGKTTAVRLLAGLDQPDSGSVEVFGKNVGSLSRLERGEMALLAQDPALVPQFSIAEQVGFAAKLRGVRTDVSAALERVGLADKGSTRLADASGGMKRRTGLAASLVCDPALVFCDEPTAGLDPIVRETVWSWFRERRSNGRSMLVTTQHIDEAARCDRVIVLRAGEVIANTTPDSITHDAGLSEEIVVTIRPEDVWIALVALQENGVINVERTAAGTIVVSAKDAADMAGTITNVLGGADVEIHTIDTVVPGLDDVFRSLVESR